MKLRFLIINVMILCKKIRISIRFYISNVNEQILQKLNYKDEIKTYNLINYSLNPTIYFRKI